MMWNFWYPLEMETNLIEVKVVFIEYVNLSDRKSLEGFESTYFFSNIFKWWWWHDTEANQEDIRLRIT